jgi:hypothetical protein
MGNGNNARDVGCRIHGSLLTGDSRKFPGTLYGSDGAVLRSYPVGMSHDRIPVTDLLAAAGVPSLDVASDYDGSKSYREMGVALQLQIHYSNRGGAHESAEPGGGGGGGYSYKVTRVPSTRVRRLRTSVHGEGGSRSLHAAFGISIMTHLTGDVSDWSASSILSKVVQPAVANSAIVHTIMYYVIWLVPYFQSHGGTLIREPQPRKRSDWAIKHMYSS